MWENNSTGILSNCPYQIWYTNAGQTASLIAYYIVAPIYFFCGLSIHIVCIRAFTVEAKKDGAYVHQIFVNASQILQVIFGSLYVVAFQWWGNPSNPGPYWYRSCYTCMWITAHISASLTNTSYTMSELLILCTSADRLYALWKPFKYRSINTKRYRVISACICIPTAFLLSLFQIPRFKVERVDDGPMYKVVLNLAYAYSSIGTVLSQFRNAIETLALICLYFCNIGMIWFFRKYRKQNDHTSNQNQQHINKRKAERTLSLLAICQSICVTVYITHRAVYFTMSHLDPHFYNCQRSLHLPLMIMCMQLMDLCEFLCLFSISKQFRKMIIRAIWCGRTQQMDSPNVAPMQRETNDIGSTMT